MSRILVTLLAVLAALVHVAGCATTTDDLTPGI